MEIAQLNQNESLQTLASRDAVAASIISVLPQCFSAESQETPAQCLEECARVPRGEVVRVLKEFQDLGLGKLLLGRRGHPTRFAWSARPGEIPERKPSPAVIRRPKPANTNGNGHAAPPESELTTLEFRSGKQAILPADLTPSDLWDLVAFISAKTRG